MHPETNNIHAIRFKGVILDIGDYTTKGVI